MSTSTKPVVYGRTLSRSLVLEWYLKELSVDFDMKEMDVAAKENKTDWFLQISPFGKVPAYKDDNMALFETGAILMYLAERHGGVDTLEKRAEMLPWVFYAFSTMYDACYVEQHREKQMAPCLEALNGILENKTFLIGEELSVADIAVGSHLLFLPLLIKDLDCSPYPHIVKYMQHLQARAACTINAPPTNATT